MQLLLRWMIFAASLFAALPASAQNSDTYFGTPGGGGVNGSVGMCLNALKQAVPCSDPSALPGSVSGTVTANQGGAPWSVTETSAPASVTVTTPSVPTPGTFVAVLPANAARKSCTVTNIGATLGYCNAVAQPSATTANTMPVPANGGQFFCQAPNGPPASNPVSCTCASGTCAFAVNEQ